MKLIKIFLASSIVEFKHEREEFGTFIRCLNNIYAKRDIYFELVVCEDMAKELHERRMQEIYNDKIRDSRYFYIIVGKNLGDRSLEEFDVALRNFMTNGVPRILTYFYTVPEGEPIAQSVRDFMTRLDVQLGHDYNVFDHFDTIKLDFLMGMHQDPELQGDIAFRDGTAVLDGEAVMLLENVPIYGKNKSLMAMKSRKEGLDRQFADVLARYTANPNDNTLYQNLMEVSEERTRVSDALRSAEKEVLSLCVDITRFRTEKGERTWREEEAIRLTNQGNYEAALAVLRDKERKKELEHAVTIVDGQLAVVAGYIQENLLRIKTLRAQGLDEKRVLEIEECYEEIVPLVRKYHVEEHVVYDYTVFLLDGKGDFDKAISVANGLRDTKWAQDSTFMEAQINEILGYAFLYGMHDLQNGKKYYQRAADGYTRCNDSKKWNRLCHTYDMLSRACQIEGNKQQAIHLAQEGLKIAEEHAGKYWKLCVFLRISYLYQSSDMENAKKYADAACSIAERFFKNTGTLKRAYDRKRDIARAEKNYEEAVRFGEKSLLIAKELSKKNPYTEMDTLFWAYRGMAYLLRDMGEYDQALSYFENALPICRELCRRNPWNMEAALAGILHDYGNALAEEYKYKEAASAHREAMQIQKRLIGRDDGYIHEVLYSTRQLAADLLNLHQFDEAENLYRESVDLGDQSAKEGECYSGESFESKRQLAWALMKRKRYKEAERLYKEAADYQKSKILDGKGSLETLSLIWNGYGCLCVEIKKFQEAAALLQEGLAALFQFYHGNEGEALVRFSVFYHNIALCSYEAGMLDQAFVECERVYHLKTELVQSVQAGTERYMADTTKLYSDILRDLNRLDEAKNMYEKTLALYRQLYEICPQAFDDSLAEVCVDYAKLLIRTGDNETARSLCEEAVTLCQNLMKLAPEVYKELTLKANEVYMEILRQI